MTWLYVLSHNQPFAIVEDAKKPQKNAKKRAVAEAEAKAAGGDPCSKKPKAEPGSEDALPVPDGSGWKNMAYFQICIHLCLLICIYICRYSYQIKYICVYI